MFDSPWATLLRLFPGDRSEAEASFSLLFLGPKAQCNVRLCSTVLSVTDACRNHASSCTEAQIYYKLRAACLHSDELYTYILLASRRSLRYNKNSFALFLFARFEDVKPVCWYPENAQHLVTVPSLDNNQITEKRGSTFGGEYTGLSGNERQRARQGLV